MSSKHPRRVYNVIPGDFTQDGRLDLLVYSQSSKSGEVAIELYVASPTGGFGAYPLWLQRRRFTKPPVAEFTPISAPASASAQPIPMDINGDLKIDLFGIPSSSLSSSPFKVWQNVWNASASKPDLFDMYVVQGLLVYIFVSIRWSSLTVSTQSSVGRNAPCQTLIATPRSTSTETALQVRNLS